MTPLSTPETLRDEGILIVDDEDANVRVLERLLDRAGYQNLRSTSDPREVEDIFLEYDPDLILLDLHMPHLDGFAVMEMLREHIGPETYLPILVLTGDPDREVKERALSAGARDFVTKPFDSTEVLLRIQNLLETRCLHQELRAHSETLEEKVRERTRELAQAQIEILHRLVLAAEYRDDMTGRHAERVGVLSALVGSALGVGRERVEVIRRAAPLHDVGKIGIPDAILMKPGPLTPAEFEVMKNHTTIGARILAGTDYSLLETARTVARSHHEKWDGTGYPDGLAGEDIPLVGRIVSVADVFDSLTHERPYKMATPPEEAVEMIREEREQHFDPEVADAFLRVIGRLEEGSLDRLVGVSADELARGPDAALRAASD